MSAVQGGPGNREVVRPRGSRPGSTRCPGTIKAQARDWRPDLGLVSSEGSGPPDHLGQPVLGSSLLLVFLQKLVCMAQDHLPLTVLPAVCLRTAKCERPRLAADVPGHVLQVDGVAQVLTDHRHDILLAAIGSSEAFRSPIEAGTDLLPSALIAAESAHNHYIVSVRPQCLEGFRSPRNHLTLGVLNRSHEPLPGLIHVNMMSKLGLTRNRSASRALAWARNNVL